MDGINTPVGFTVTALKAAINQPHKYPVAKLEAIWNIVSVLKKAKYIQSTPDRKGRGLIHHYLKTVIAGEDSFINIRETVKDGNVTFYTITDRLKKKGE